MSAATRATTARQRATIALEMLARTRDPFYGMPRSYDDCFEMNDGDQVIREGKLSLNRSDRYRQAVLVTGRHYAPIAWIEHAKFLAASERDADRDMLGDDADALFYAGEDNIGSK